MSHRITGEHAMITDLEEETLDLKWFSVDDSGEIAHFASGGRGFLPPSVKASKSNLDRLKTFFRKDLSPNGIGIVSANLLLHEHFESEAEKTRYLEFFSQNATKGLYSFDCFIDATRPTGYFLVVTPSRPLKVDDLPHDIRQILNLTHYAGKFCGTDLVKENEIL